VLAAKEKTVSPGAPPLQSETRIWGVKPENEMLIGRCSQVSSTLQWGSWHFYAGTASGELVNRYYSNAYGRFMTPDPYYGSANIRSPQSWNRYAYVWDDPVNSHDPSGLCDTVVGGITESSGADSGEGQFATGISAMLAYPYAGTTTVNGVADVVNTTYNQSVEANTVAVAIEAAEADSSGPINIYAFSGGAAATTKAFSMLPASVIARIASITYASPGTAGVLGTVNGITPTVIFGTGAADIGTTTLMASALMPGGWNIVQTNCAHNFGCEIGAASAAGLLPSGNPCNQPITFSAQHLTTLQEIENWTYQIAYYAAWEASMQVPPAAPMDFEPISFWGLVSNPQSAVWSTITYSSGGQ
jgi:RHS repeat-associated protein